MEKIDFRKGWKVLQDIYEVGEDALIFQPGWDPTIHKNDTYAHLFSEWEPIDHLAHLQTLLPETPYFGHELRYFNQAPWWYKYEFVVSQESFGDFAVLRFDGVDYFCKVWLNGTYLGDHEGYSTPFEFEAGNILKPSDVNTLIVKVWSPWRTSFSSSDIVKAASDVSRDLVKATYQHADTFIQRDVNPVGIWNSVSLTFHYGIRFTENPSIQIKLSEDYNIARLNISAKISNIQAAQKAIIKCIIFDISTGTRVCADEKITSIETGEAQMQFQLAVNNPKLWHTWDRGEQQMYTAVIEVWTEGGCVQSIKECFGIRSIKLHRTDKEMTYYLNGEKLFLRGTTYFPDIFISNMHYQRYRRDLEGIRSSGCNAVRVHVHTERPEFYELCDEIGLVVIQDFDWNVNSPTDEEWIKRAVHIFGNVICSLRNHPSIISWICMNEPLGDSEGIYMKKSPGPQLLAEVERLDPDRPAIKGSGCINDLESGDSHNYLGSLCGERTRYTEIFEQRFEKLCTEFGVDAPGCIDNLRCIPKIYQRLLPLEDNIEEIQYYQYRLIKYYIEHYRITKYNPCSGYFQFMFIDLCPQSFYGIYDWWGIPKEGLKALLESNMPLGIFMEYEDGPIAIWLVNDMLETYKGCTAEWTVTDHDGLMLMEGSKEIDIAKDSIIRLCDFSFSIKTDTKYNILLSIHDSKGKLITSNTYINPFHHPVHPKGHPDRMSNELGMRLYWI